MKPRWERGYSEENYPDEHFIGYAEEFDVYFDADEHSECPITVVAEKRGLHGHSFDGFGVNGNEITPAPHPDLNVTPYHMCLIYALALEHGIIKGEEGGTKMDA